MPATSPDLEVQLGRLNVALSNLRQNAPEAVFWGGPTPQDLRQGEVTWVSYPKTPEATSITFRTYPADKLSDALMKSSHARGLNVFDGEPTTASLILGEMPMVSFFTGRPLHAHSLPLEDLSDPARLVGRLADSLSDPNPSIRPIR